MPWKSEAEAAARERDCSLFSFLSSPPPPTSRGALRPSPFPRPPPGRDSAMTSPRRPVASPPPARDPGAEIDRCRSQGQCLPGVTVAVSSLLTRPLCPLHFQLSYPRFFSSEGRALISFPRLLASGHRGRVCRCGPGPAGRAGAAGTRPAAGCGAARGRLVPREGSGRRHTVGKEGAGV